MTGVATRARYWPLFCVLAVAVASLALVACSSGDDDASALRSFDSSAARGEGDKVVLDEAQRDAGGSLAGVAAGAEPAVPRVAIADGAAPNSTLPLPSNTQLDRKIIQNVTISIETEAAEDVGKRYEDVRALASANGGYIASSTVSLQEDRQIASITIKIPADRYEDVKSQIWRLGKVTAEEGSSSDVSEEHTDLQARLRNLQTTERQYIELLELADDINTILLLQDRINGVRLEIERTQGRIDQLDNLTGFATITVHITPPGVPLKVETDGDARSPLEVAADAFDASLVVLLGIATVALAVGAFSWWLLPLAAAGVFVGRRALREQRRQGPEPPVA